MSSSLTPFFVSRRKGGKTVERTRERANVQRIPASQVGQGARYGPTSSFNNRTSVASSSVNLRGSDRSPPAPSASDTNFYPGDPNDWSKEDDDWIHNSDPKDRKVRTSGRRAVFSSVSNDLRETLDEEVS